MKITITLILILALTLNIQCIKHHHNKKNTETTYIHHLTEPINIVLTNTSQPSILPMGWGVTEQQSYYKSISNLNSNNWIVGNQSIDNYTNKIFQFVTKNNITKCPDYAPYVKLGDTKCFNCTGDNPLFDLQSESCSACPSGTIFDLVSHTCKTSTQPQCNQGQTWDVTLKKCVAPPVPNNTCSGNKVWDANLKSCTCPTTLPIDLGCECVTCLQPFVWSSTEKTCKLRCPQTYIWDVTAQKCICPKENPYQINGECIACNLPFAWNATSKVCDFKVSGDCRVSTQAATKPTSTNTNTSLTSSGVTQPNSNTTTLPTTSPTTNCSSNYIYDSNLKICTCPSNLPFNDGTKCVDCQLPQYWDHNLKQCVYCPDFQYFNTINQSCEACPSTKPLYKNKLCQACPNGTLYDKQSNTCK